jgi:multiple sugar transport system permease protein
MPRPAAGRQWLLLLAAGLRLGPERAFPWLMVGPAVCVILAVMLYPIASLVLMSLRDYGSSTTNYTWVGAKWYRLLPADPRFVDGLKRTLVYSAGSVAGAMGLGTVMALILKRKFPGITLVRTLFILPMVVMPVASALIWGTMFNPSQGVLNYFLETLGLPRSLWLADPDTVLRSLILVEIWMGAPFVMLIVLAGLHTMPSEPFESAQIDGASSLAQFWYLTLPMLRASLATAMLFRLIDTLKQFPLIWVLTQGGPLRASETLYVYGYALGFQYFDLGYGSAVLMSLLVLVLIISGAWMRIRERTWL